jgi:hypothetical protein
VAAEALDEVFQRAVEVPEVGAGVQGRGAEGADGCLEG